MKNAPCRNDIHKWNYALKIAFNPRNVITNNIFITSLAMSLLDLGCKRPIPSARLTMHPEELCIPANSSREVKIILLPTETDVVHCAEKPSIIGAIAMLYGDEVTRQQLRR